MGAPPPGMQPPHRASQAGMPPVQQVPPAPAVPRNLGPAPAPAPMPSVSEADDSTPVPGPLPVAPEPPPEPREAPRPMAPVAPAPMPPVAPAPVEPPRPMAPVAPAPRPAPTPAAPASPALESRPVGDDYPELLAQVVRSARQRGVDPASEVADETSRTRARPLVEQAARAVNGLPPGVTHERLAKDALAELLGAGAIETALESADVTTVLVDGSGRVSVGRSGAIAQVPYWFSSPAALGDAVDRLLRSSGIERNPSHPVVDVSLKDGLKLLAVFPPATGAGPVAAVERIPKAPASLGELASRGVLSTPAVHLLEQALAARRNVLVAGPSGAGRSTFLAALVAALPAHDRVTVVEGREELSRARRDATVVRSQGEGTRPVSLALRLRPQRLVVGDVDERGAQDLSAALATGAEGWLLGVQGPTGALALSWLASRGAHEGWFGRDEVTARLASTRPLVVELARFGDGSCRVTSIGEARPGEGGVRLEALFQLKLEGFDASGALSSQLVPTGNAPSFKG